MGMMIKTGEIHTRNNDKRNNIKQLVVSQFSCREHLCLCTYASSLFFVFVRFMKKISRNLCEPEPEPGFIPPFECMRLCECCGGVESVGNLLDDDLADFPRSFIV